MKSLYALLFFLTAACCAAPGFAATIDFGSPPSGTIPIIFNDRHVYARPDELQKGRVLAALVKNGEILIPLRALFQEMGATVTFGDDETIEVRSAQTVVHLKIGVSEITIDGERRPLDVPPVRYKNDVLVPIRVVSEALGAYVAWLPEFRAVAIRFNPISAVVPAPYYAKTVPPASAAATPAPAVVVPPGPPVPVGPPASETIIAFNDVYEPKVDNAYSPGNVGDALQSFDVRGDFEVPIFGANVLFDGEAQRDVYATDGRATTNLDGSRAFAPAFIAKDFDYDLHLGFQLTPQKYYIAFGYVNESTNYGYPRAGGLGVGLEKLPELQHRFSFDGDIFYYPNVSGTCTCPSGSVPLSYSLVQYRGGITYSLPRYIFLDAGVLGEATHKKSAPVGTSEIAPALGLGLYF